MYVNRLTVQQLPGVGSWARPIDSPMGRGAPVLLSVGPSGGKQSRGDRRSMWSSLAPRLLFHLEVLCHRDSLQLLGNRQVSRHSYSGPSLLQWDSLWMSPVPRTLCTVPGEITEGHRELCGHCVSKSHSYTCQTTNQGPLLPKEMLHGLREQEGERETQGLVPEGCCVACWSRTLSVPGML